MFVLNHKIQENLGRLDGYCKP